MTRSYGNSMFNFLKNCQTFPKKWQRFTFPLAVEEGAHVSTRLSILLIVFGFYFSLVGVKWYLIVDLICMSLKTNDGKFLILCLSATWIFSLEKCLFRPVTRFLISLSFYCKASQCIRGTSPLSGVWYTNIVSHSVGEKGSLSLIFLMVSFQAQKFLILMKSYLFIYFCCMWFWRHI